MHYSIFLFVTCGLLAALHLSRQKWLRAIGNFLIAVDTATPDYDAIVLMNGNISTRPFRAAKLYKERPAPILLARLADTEEVRMGVIPNISESTCTLLTRLGVPEGEIRFLKSERWIAGTWDEAILLCAYVRKNNYRKVLIVTDAFHTRRARWAFRKVMSDDNFEFYCAGTPVTLNIANHWWSSEYGIVQVLVEYLKFMHYRRLFRATKNSPRPQESDLPLARDIRPLVHK
jgi:uncharacterized SAM-binding protein YcdF (DUF218 family)